MGWNVRHFHERYRSEHGGTRSYGWVKRVLQAAGSVERRPRKAVSERPRREVEPEPIVRRPREGMLLHQIASRREWVLGHTWDLILMVDDATDRVHSGFFVEERGIWSIFAGIRQMLERGFFGCLSFGVAIPSRLTARETAFGGLARPQLERVMWDLEIDMVRPVRRVRMSNARLFRTLFGRLPVELAREGIAGIEQANTYLARFWASFNEFRAVKPADDTTDAFLACNTSLLAGITESVFFLKHQASACAGNRLLCEGMELNVTGLDPHNQCLDRQHWIHEYEDGRCELFHGSDRIAAIDVNEASPT